MAKKKKRKNSFFKDPQNITALGVTLISVCALMVSIKQTQIMSEERTLAYEQAKASVWPRLELGANFSMSDDDRSIEAFSLILTNGGIGPAIVTQARVTYEGQAVKDWWELFAFFNLPDSLDLSVSNADFHDSIIKIGEERIVLSLDENLPLAQAYFDHQAKIKIEVFYESIYKDKWKVTYQNWTNNTIETTSHEALEGREYFGN